MANVGSGSSGKTLIGAGNGASPTYASIGTNSGLNAHGVVIAEGNGAFVATSTGSIGQVLTSNGPGSDPTFQAAVPAIPVTVPNGGTGDTSFTAYSVICGGTTSTGALQNVSGVGTSGQVLTSNGSSSLPSWQAAGGGLSTFLSVALNSNTSNLSSGALSTVVFDTVLIDTASGYSSGIYTVPSTGTWLITMTAYFLSSAAFTACDCFINKNSGTYLLHIVGNTTADGINQVAMTASGVFSLTLNDTIQISVFANTTGAVVYYGSGAGNGYYCTFSVTKLS